MPVEYIGKWEDGETHLTFSKLFDVKTKLIESYGWNREQERALAIYLTEIGVSFFGHNITHSNFASKPKFLKQLRD